jgi:hypothetical protein
VAGPAQGAMSEAVSAGSDSRLATAGLSRRRFPAVIDLRPWTVVPRFDVRVHQNEIDRAITRLCARRTERPPCAAGDPPQSLAAP